MDRRRDGRILIIRDAMRSDATLQMQSVKMKVLLLL